MTGKLSILFLGLIAAGGIVDAVYTEGEYTLFLVKRFVHLFDWLAFWR